jgi:hypothetical protein
MLALAAAVTAASLAAWTLAGPGAASADELTAGGFTTNASASPGTVAPGATASITLSVTAANATTALVDIEVYSPAGAKVHQQWYDAQAFSSGQQRNFQASWPVPAGTAAGTYTVRAGIFSTGWGTLHHWNNEAAAFVVGGGGGQPTQTQAPAPTQTPAPAPTSPPGGGGGGLAPLPAGWPSANLELGLSDSPGGASSMLQTAPYRFRYQYLAGGVNTGNGWANWNANGAFVTNYVQESRNAGIVPVFTYYMIFQSAPGNSQGEADGVYNNMQNTQTMTSYYNDLKLFFQRAGAFPTTRVVFHVEPDLWGYMQQRASGDNASTVPAKVAATGLAELAGLPNTMAGFAQALDRLRDTYAPNVMLGYHVSVWGTGNDITYSDPPDATVDALAQRAAAFANSLGGGFDIAFGEFSDRDSGFKQAIYGDGGGSWWNAGDFARNVRFVRGFSQGTQKRVVMWQIPQGNTKMRAMNNTWNHYQDNRVEWLLDEPARTHLRDYVNAGVVAFLFGRGADGATCSCDANGDGVTNPSPINGNTGLSLNSDDDGGFFRQKAQAYYQAGAMALTGSSPPPPSTPTATPPPPSTPTAVPTIAPDTTPPSLSITSPVNEATVSGVVTIAATASDAGGMHKVRFWAGASYLGYDASVPYAKTWDTRLVPNGRYTIKLQALDDANNSTVRTIRVTVINPDSSPPAVSITEPVNGATVQGVVTLRADASDAEGLQKVRFWAGDAYLGYDTTAPYSMSWDSAAAPDGTAFIRAQAVDWANHMTSTVIEVDVAN